MIADADDARPQPVSTTHSLSAVPVRARVRNSVCPRSLRRRHYLPGEAAHENDCTWFVSEVTV